MGLEGGMGAGLVAAHHARIAGDIGADDGGQTSFHNPELQGIDDRPPRGSRLESRISKNPAFIEQIRPGESMIRIANLR
jgi:hypothetical protein